MNKLLWAPWREKVIYQKKHQRCIFCVKPKENKDRKNYIFSKRRHTFAMLNLYPYNNGHILVAPHRHIRTLEALTPQELSALIIHLQDSKKILKRLLKPHGFNIGLNEGQAAGAGFENHIHFHLVPRWNGDTNYMPVFSRTKVISESLDALYEKMIHVDAH